MTSHRTPEFSPTPSSCNWKSVWHSINHKLKSSLNQVSRAAAVRLALVAWAVLDLFRGPERTLGPSTRSHRNRPSPHGGIPMEFGTLLMAKMLD